MVDGGSYEQARRSGPGRSKVFDVVSETEQLLEIQGPRCERRRGRFSEGRRTSVISRLKIQGHEVG